MLHNATVNMSSSINATTNTTITTTTPGGGDCFDTAFRIIICLLLGATGAVASAANILVCMAIISSNKLRTLTNSMLVSLSVSDVIVSLTLPTCEIVYVYFYPVWPLGRVGTYVLNSMWLFSLVSPFVCLIVITFDRYMVITSNSINNLWRTPRSVGIAIAITWLYSGGIVALMASYFTWPGNDSYEWNILEDWYYPFLCIHIVIPLLVIIILYVKIIRVSRRSRTQASLRANNKDNNVAMLRREIRLAQTITIVVGLLLMVWLPVLVLEYFYAVGSESCLVSKLGVVSVWLICVNGMLNPFVYAFRNVGLRKGVYNVVTTSVFCRPCLGEHSNESMTSKITRSTTSSKKTGSERRMGKSPWRQRTLYKGTGGDNTKSNETIRSDVRST